MGYDRIAYFNGKKEESTLISADKESSKVVYGSDFQYFCRYLGYKVRQVVDESAVPRFREIINTGDAQIDALPKRAVDAWFTGGMFVELQPPVSDETMRVLNAYFVAHCEPTDAGLILDARDSHTPVTVVDGM